MNLKNRHIPTWLLAAVVITVMILFSGCVSKGEGNIYAGMSVEQLRASGKRCMIEGKADSAVIYYTLLTEACRDKEDTKSIQSYASACNNLGYIYFFSFGDYSRAYEFLQKSKNAAERIGASSTLARVYLNMGNIYSHYDLTDRTLDMYRKAVSLALAEGDYGTAVTTFINIIGGRMGMGDYSHISDDIKEFSSAALPDTVVMGRYSGKLVEACKAIAAKDYDGACKALEESEALIDTDFNRDRYAMISRMVLADVLVMKGERIRPAEIVKDVEEASRRKGDVDIVGECYSKLNRYYGLQGDSLNAVKYRLMALEMSDSLFNAKKLMAITDIDKSASLKQLNDRIVDLKKEKRFQLLLTAVVSSTLIVILILLLFLFKKHRSLNDSHKELYLRYRQLTEEWNRDKANMKAMESKMLGEEARPKETEQESRPQTALLSDAQAESLYMAILSVIESDAVLDPNFSVDALASAAGTKARYVSYALNLKGGKNFSVLLAEERIRRACRILEDPSSDNLTLESIGESVGFKSRITFSSTFKKVTGLSPKDFKKTSRLSESS